jgi:hypothetical protein
MRIVITCGALALALSLGACAAAEERKPPPLPSAADALAAVQPIIDCEWKAVHRLDNGSYTVSELANRIMGSAALSVSRQDGQCIFRPTAPKPNWMTLRWPLRAWKA